MMVKLQYLALIIITTLLSTNINVAFAEVKNNQNKSKSIVIAQSPEANDEMLDALQNRQEKLENIQELKEAQDSLDKEQQNQEKLDILKEQNINIDNVEQLTQVQEIINNPDLDDTEILKLLQEQNINIESTQQLKQIRKIINKGSVVADESGKLSATTAFRMFTIGIPSSIIILLIGTRFSKAIFATIKCNYQQNHGKPPIPERSLNLHHNNLKQVVSLGKKAEKIDDDKFGNE